MNIKAFVRQILLDTEITNLTADKDVYFLHAINAKPPYLEYEIIDEYGVNFAENKETSTNFILQVDIFSKGDYTDLENKVKDKLIGAGFARTTAYDLYEEDTNLFHKAMRFLYTKE